MTPPFKLRFFVLGAQKCATSWLSYCLRDHPAVHLPGSKIEHAYLGGRMFRERGEEWYFDRFTRNGTGGVYGEVAVDYMLDAAVPTVLQGYAEDPRFVVMIRHPVDRLISAYYWSVRRSQLPDLPLEAGIARLLDAAPGFPERYENRYFDELVRRGFYGQQIQSYLDVFGPERFLVITHEEVSADRSAVIRRVYRHIGVQEDFVPPHLGVTPKKNSYNRFALKLERLSTSWNMGRVADRLNRFLARVTTADPGLDPRSRNRLRALFQPHVAETQAVLQALPDGNRPSSNLLELWR